MTQNNSDEVQARQSTRRARRCHGGRGLASAVPPGQEPRRASCNTAGHPLASASSALVDGPLSLLGYAFATASVLMFWRMKYVLVEFDRQNRCSGRLKLCVFRLVYSPRAAANKASDISST